MTSLISKYNIPGPRYTSYPTVPYWDRKKPGIEQWTGEVKNAFCKAIGESGISMYLHLPFCESLCTYCGCNTRITKNHGVEEPYIRSLLKEWKMYQDIFTEKPKIQELHLGGGTPTFFHPDNLCWLISEIKESALVSQTFEFGFEAHPNSTSTAHLEKMHELGFSRLSLGIQDFDPKVQRVINRIQDFKTVKQVTEVARSIGYQSINYDLIYGLPFQTEESIYGTFEKIGQMQPDRIANYSYAHVPWIKPGQRMFTKMDLPGSEEKRKLYELGKYCLEEQGYVEIGMDHFALPSDSLCCAAKEGTLHRNFMGYTPHTTHLLIGLGASSISDAWTMFAQNVKQVEAYRESIDRGVLPIFKGHVLNGEDLVIRQHISDLMCNFETRRSYGDIDADIFEETLWQLEEMEKDHLVELGDDYVKVKDEGRPFLRNICMAFDLRLKREKPDTQIFSNTV